MAAPLPGDYAAVQIPWVSWHGKSVPNLMGYLIRLFTWSRFDHAFLYIGDGKIVEAQPSGARISDLSDYAGHLMVWSEDPLSDAERAAVVSAAKGMVGRGYGFMDIVYLGVSRFGFQPRWLLNLVENENRLICSQLVALAGKLGGVTAWLCGESNACLVTPGDLGRRVPD